MKKLTLNQGTDAWKAWRREGVGGSDLVALLGLTPPWPPPLPSREDLFREKVEGLERESNFAMRRGNRLEPVARLAYEQASGCVALPVCVESESAPWTRCSLDGLCSDHRLPPAERVEWILELKAPSWQAHDTALAGYVPDYYRPQCQWQLLVTGLERLDYCSYSEHSRFGSGGNGDRLAIVTVLPDAEEQARLLEEVGRFWFEVCERRAALPAAPKVDERFAAETI